MVFRAVYTLPPSYLLIFPKRKDVRFRDEDPSSSSLSSPAVDILIAAAQDELQGVH